MIRHPRQDQELDGHDPADPADHLALQMAVVGARLLSCPDLGPARAADLGEPA
jgi:hypothetical protein